MIDFEKYLGIPYERNAYPTLEKGNLHGANCIKLIHEIYAEEFGVQLPLGLWPKELLLDNELTRSITDGNYVLGDMFTFGEKGNKDLIGLHLGMYTGVRQNGDPLLIHSTNRKDNISAVWPLRRFSTWRPYSTIYGVKRLREDLFETFIKPHIGTAILQR